MTRTAEEYGRRPIPADKWVRSTLENALFDARESLATVEIEKIRAHGAAAKADEMHLLWLSRISHLEAAMAALDAIPESVPPVGRPWAFPAKLGEGLVCTTEPIGSGSRLNRIEVEVQGGGGGGGYASTPGGSFPLSGVAGQGSAGLPAGSQSQPLHGVAGVLAEHPEMVPPLNTQPLSPPPYCDRCERPLGPGHACLPAEADAARFTALPSSRRPDRTTGEDSQEL